MKYLQGLRQKQKRIQFDYKRLMSGIALFALFFMPNFATSASISDIDKKIQETQAKLNQTTAQRKTLQGEVAYFDNEITSTQAEINRINANISKINSDISNTQAKIVESEEKLQTARGQLGEIMKVMYEEGQTSNIELIAKSSSFSELMNRSEYLESINLRVKETTDDIISLKNELNTKKTTLEDSKKNQQKLIANEASQKQTLADQRYSKDLVLQKTKGQEGAYQTLMKQLYSERIAAAASSGETIGGGGSGGYPYTGSCGGVDPWAFYKCQCTSYAAWYWNSHGKDWTNSRPGQGNAHNWYNLATDQGYTWSYTPRVGDIAVWPLTGLTPYGHVAIVTGVSGGTISVSEYNWSRPEAYGTRTGVSSSGLKFIH